MILSGKANLLELNNKSLALRGRPQGGSGKMSKEEIRAISAANASTKRKRVTEEVSPFFRKISKVVVEDDMPSSTSTLDGPQSQASCNSSNETNTSYLIAKIAASSSTPFQKRVLTALMQVPRGEYTTYGILAKYLSSSARAVGNGLRNNPFAPQVPCHRVLASGGGIGGFKGSWGRNGQEGLNDGEKRKFLREEGVKFDGLGRVVGRPWDGFK